MSDISTNSVPETTDDSVKWYIKYRQQLYAAAIFIIGLFGGNVDRISSTLKGLLPTSINVEAIEERLDDLDARVTELESEKSEQLGGLPYRTIQ